MSADTDARLRAIELQIHRMRALMAVYEVLLARTTKDSPADMARVVQEVARRQREAVNEPDQALEAAQDELQRLVARLETVAAIGPQSPARQTSRDSGA